MSFQHNRTNLNFPRVSFGNSCWLQSKSDIFIILVSRVQAKGYSQYIPLFIRVTLADQARINRGTHCVGIQLLPLLLVLGPSHGGFRCDTLAVFRHLFVLFRFTAATEAQQAIHDHAHNYWLMCSHTPTHPPIHTRTHRARLFPFLSRSNGTIPHFHQSRPSLPLRSMI